MLLQDLPPLVQSAKDGTGVSVLTDLRPMLTAAQRTLQLCPVSVSRRLFMQYKGSQQALSALAIDIN